MTEPEDLTARARIRDAALRHFGEHGFDRATIRGIAETAGVSSGLVRHHFGSKEALRDACDAHLAKALGKINDQVRADSSPGEVNYVAVAGAVFGPYRAYVLRALTEGRAAPVFDELVRLGAQWLAEADEKRSDAPEVPREARATVGAAMALSVAVLHEHVSRGLGVDVFSPEGADLLARALLDIYSHPYLSPEEAAEMRDRLPQGGKRTG
ncbi:transcriptional regulator, TetR family [Saccharopolyspora kobensis]|uniref:Transcriptional regulator, TetR family n=1 Tax=Saccharopolyspora kobensis TaxID=146035 RepID=A0A1H6A2A7_9PSEU|nr:TetR/AcrR family transcriptional regulator [Saccharopolyspora kobensis]SEG42185.1 transcriptional regulator, TetR family [Saccharopolyspora kobensis]SFE17489.1 transcriptional regulator, TetR family [Saccharopolyspora kobensis]